jgi:hypothetical protein
LDNWSFRIKWVFVGSPLTQNALNDGKANFPEFHNVYIEPGSYEIYKKTGEFPGRGDRLGTHPGGRFGHVPTARPGHLGRRK